MPTLKSLALLALSILAAKSQAGEPLRYFCTPQTPIKEVNELIYTTGQFDERVHAKPFVTQVELEESGNQVVRAGLEFDVRSRNLTVSRVKLVSQKPTERFLIAQYNTCTKKVTGASERCLEWTKIPYYAQVTSLRSHYLVVLLSHEPYTQTLIAPDTKKARLIEISENLQTICPLNTNKSL